MAATINFDDKLEEASKSDLENNLMQNTDKKEEIVLKNIFFKSDEECSISSRISNISCKTLSRVGSYSDVSIKKSKDVHFGHKIFAAPITMINNVQENINEEAESKKGLCFGVVYRVKNATRMEKIVCILVMVFLSAISTILTLHIADFGQNQEVEMELNHLDPNANWYINRDGWLAAPAEEVILENTKFHPIKYVILGHTVTSPCTTFQTCAAEVRFIQAHFIDVMGWGDTAYNFLIGGDGRAYEGLGWYKIGAHTLGFNNRSIGINFIGDYRSRIGSGVKLIDNQVRSLYRLLDNGVKLKVLDENFILMCHCDVVSGSSPGDNAYNVITKWSRYQNVYNNTCFW